MDRTFEGKVALVTGAAAGMGFATAKAFADAGASVVLADVDADAVQAAAASLTSGGGQAIGVACDVAEEAQAAAAVGAAVSTYGRLDAAYNNAGVQPAATDTADLEAEEFDRVMAVNLRGVWNCMKHELRQMREQGEGTIVNCSSIGGLVGVPDRAAYHATKHGVIGLTKSSALEYAARGIRINAICPGIIDTPMVAAMKEGESEAMEELMAAVPVKRLGHPQEIASAVLWLSGPGSTFVIGHALVVDGGYTVP
jgi:NAD(P)-dependent dehydrogenase (short-subunit alcohol dehydrogenase family)